MRFHCTWILLLVLGVFALGDTAWAQRSAPTTPLQQQLRQKFGPRFESMTRQGTTTSTGRVNLATSAIRKSGGRIQGGQGGSISGHLTGLAADDHLKGQIWAFSTDSSTLVQDPTGGTYYMSAGAAIEADGSYRIVGLLPGDYWVLADVYGYVQQLYDGVQDLDRATLVTVADGADHGDVDFTMQAIPTGDGSITGTIVDESNGRPIEGVSVYAMSLDDPNLTGWGVSGPDGTYEIPKLVGGSYLVQVYAMGYFPELYDNTMDPNDARPVQVVEPNATPGIDFALSQGSGISGRVTDDNGNPVVGASVQVMSSDLSGSDPNGRSFGGWAFTDDNGDYLVTGLPSGEYLVAVIASANWMTVEEWYDNATNPYDATPVVVGNDQTTPGIDFVVDFQIPDGVVTGHVADANGKPVVGAFIYLEPSTSTQGNGPWVWMYAETDANGDYAITAVQDGEYFVSVYAQNGWNYSQIWWPNALSPDNAGPVKVTGGASDPASVDFVLPIEVGTGSISGVVKLGDGTPAESAWIQVFSIDPATGSFLYGAATLTDADGAYTVPGVPAGSYKVMAIYGKEEKVGEQWFENATSPETATTIDIADGGSRSGVNFILNLRSYYGNLSGTVTDDATGLPIDRALVEVSPIFTGKEGYNGITYSYSQFQTVTDAKGKYEFEMLPEGEYLVSVFADGAFEVYENAATFDEGKPVQVTGGGSATADFGMTLSVGGGSISGRVTGGGVPVDMAVVIAYDPTSDRPSFATALTDPDGTYTIRGLAKGEYQIMCFADGYISELYLDAYDPMTATMVTVNDGLTGGIDFELDRSGCFNGDGSGGIVYGRVSDISGQGLSGSTVYLVDGAGTTIASVRAGADGNYEIANIPPSGNYRAFATSKGYETVYNSNSSSLESAQPMPVNKGGQELNFVLSKGTSGVEDEPEYGTGINLSGNHPNPFNGSTRISFSLAEPMHVNVTVFDTRGQAVATVADGDLSAGPHDVSWNGTDASGRNAGPGLYYYRVQNGTSVRTGTMTLIR